MPINGWHIRGLVGVLFDVLIVEIRKLYIIEFCNIAMAVRQVTVLGILEVVFFFGPIECSCNSSWFGSLYMYMFVFEYVVKTVYRNRTFVSIEDYCGPC